MGLIKSLYFQGVHLGTQAGVNKFSDFIQLTLGKNIMGLGRNVHQLQDLTS